ncbi:MAG: zinc metallopeptidase [Opitutales bacterium]
MTLLTFPFAALLILSQPVILVLLLLSFVFALYAQIRVSSAYKKNLQVPSRGRITGREAAEAVMARAGITNVEIDETSGQLNDHYDPVNKRLTLSSDNYRGTSLAALGVAAHEAGHAIQDKVGHKLLRTRMALVPITQISSKMLPFVIFGGFVFRITGLIDVGIICYAVLTLFHLITLPVEFDASRRAKVELVGLGIVDQDEMPGVVETLNAAALTYVAAFLSSLLNLLWLISSRRN